MPRWRWSRSRPSSEAASSLPFCIAPPSLASLVSPIEPSSSSALHPANRHPSRHHVFRGDKGRSLRCLHKRERERERRESMLTLGCFWPSNRSASTRLSTSAGSVQTLLLDSEAAALERARPLAVLATLTPTLPRLLSHDLVDGHDVRLDPVSPPSFLVSSGSSRPRPPSRPPSQLTPLPVACPPAPNQAHHRHRYAPVEPPAVIHQAHLAPRLKRTGIQIKSRTKPQRGGRRKSHAWNRAFAP